LPDAHQTKPVSLATGGNSGLHYIIQVTAREFTDDAPQSDDITLVLDYRG
jgi:hypothetical protein